MYPNEYHDAEGNADLHNRGEAYPYLDPSWHASHHDAQLPALSAIGRGPRGIGLKVEPIEEEGKVAFTIIDDEFGEVQWTSPNLAPGRISVTAPDATQIAPGVAVPVEISITNGDDQETVVTYLPPGKRGTNMYGSETVLTHQDDGVYSGETRPAESMIGDVIITQTVADDAVYLTFIELTSVDENSWTGVKVAEAPLSGSEFTLPTMSTVDKGIAKCGTGLTMVDEAVAVDDTHFADVALSGDYEDLANTPDLSIYQTKPLATSDIPNLNASKITAGTLDAARIPSIPASKVTGLGALATQDAISSLPASAITGVLPATAIPSLDASKIASGTLPVSRGGTGQTTAKNAANALIGNLDEASASLLEDTYVVTGGNTESTHDLFYRRPLSAFWNWIRGNVSTEMAKVVAAKARTGLGTIQLNPKSVHANLELNDNEDCVYRDKTTGRLIFNIQATATGAIPYGTSNQLFKLPFVKRDMGTSALAVLLHVPAFIFSSAGVLKSTPDVGISFDSSQSAEGGIYLANSLAEGDILVIKGEAMRSDIINSSLLNPWSSPEDARNAVANYAMTGVSTTGQLNNNTKKTTWQGKINYTSTGRLDPSSWQKNGYNAGDNGTDCSGLVSTAYRQNGFVIPGDYEETILAQGLLIAYAPVGQELDLTYALPGDVIVFDDGSYATGTNPVQHVAMYVGTYNGIHRLVEQSDGYAVGNGSTWGAAVGKDALGNDIPNYTTTNVKQGPYVFNHAESYRMSSRERFVVRFL